MCLMRLVLFSKQIMYLRILPYRIIEAGDPLKVPIDGASHHQIAQGILKMVNPPPLSKTTQHNNFERGSETIHA